MLRPGWSSLLPSKVGFFVGLFVFPPMLGAGGEKRRCEVAHVSRGSARLVEKTRGKRRCRALLWEVWKRLQNVNAWNTVRIRGLSAERGQIRRLRPGEGPVGSSARPGGEHGEQSLGTNRGRKGRRGEHGLQKPPPAHRRSPQRRAGSSRRAVAGADGAALGPEVPPGGPGEPAQSRAEALDQIFPLLLAAFISGAASLRRPGLLAPRAAARRQSRGRRAEQPRGLR